MYFLFERFGFLKGWTFAEAAICYSVIHLSFSISECFARGFDAFSTLIVNGEFDRLLVRPRSLAIQVLGSKFEFTRFGRMFQGAVVLIWAIVQLEIDWTMLKWITLLFMIMGGVCIYVGIYMLAATLCFWTVEGLELANLLTDGSREMAQYPLNIYEKGIIRFFTYIIPFGCVSYLPLLSILDKASGNEWLYMLTPLSGCLFLLPCLAVWKMGVRHYRSTGS